MDERFQRWLDAEWRDDEPEADAAFGDLLRSVPVPELSREFSNNVVRAARTELLAAGRRSLVHPWSRATLALGLAGGGIAALYLIAVVLGPYLAAELAHLLALVARASLWVALRLSAGLDMWSIVSSAGRALGAALAAPQVSMVLLVIEVVGALALYALQRLLSSERESKW